MPSGSRSLSISSVGRDGSYKPETGKSTLARTAGAQRKTERLLAISETIVAVFLIWKRLQYDNQKKFFSFDTHQGKRRKYSVNMAVERGAGPCIPLVGWMSRAFTKD